MKSHSNKGSWRLHSSVIEVKLNSANLEASQC